MIEIRIKKIHGITAEERENLIKTLSPAARERLCKKREPNLYLSSISAYSLLTENERIDLDFTESGIPFFKTLDACISISHSQNYACVAISESKNARVGIDIEEKSATPRTSTRFLTPDEQKMLERGTPYLEIWTKKEALFKFLKNDSLPLPAIDSANSEQYGATMQTRETDEYFLTACTDKAQEDNIKLIEIN